MGDPKLASGSLFADRFTIEGPAGRGAMGTVYRARDRRSGATVAIKLLHEAAARPEESERFAREAQILSELSHPGIVSYLEHGIEDSPDPSRAPRHFLIMEWLDGESLAQHLLRGPLTTRSCVTLLLRITEALSVAHDRGIIHRDLKPTNLLLQNGDIGRVKVLDFGIARRLSGAGAMTKTGTVVGTPEYMSPEQARGNRALSPAADLFSLGCVLYECLTGEPPFAAEHVAAVLVRILFEEPRPVEERRSGVAVPIVQLVQKLLAKDPAQRPADARALHALLLPLAQLPDSLPQRRDDSGSGEARFAESERRLFSVVLAALPVADPVPDATLQGSGVLLGESERQSLLRGLVALGTRPDFLANGSLVVTVQPLDSAQDQATLAARAALLIKARWPGVVVAMATGRGTIRGHSAVGEVVEYAANRLHRASEQSAAPTASGVIVDPLSAKLLEGRFALLPQTDGALLIEEEPEADASRPLLGRPTPCVGRETELAMLEAQLAGCIEESEARVFLITAPPGTGKSRLRHEFLRRVTEKREQAARPLTVLLGRGDLMNAGTPYEILARAVRRCCGIRGSESPVAQREQLAASIGARLADSERHRVVEFIGELCGVPFPAEHEWLIAARQDPTLLHEQIRRAFIAWLDAETRDRAVLIVLDDLQWGDALSIGLLHEALHALRARPLLVLGLGRPQLRDMFPSLWTEHRPQHLTLKGLSKRACERLIKQVLGQVLGSEAATELSARLVTQSAGNALFLEEPMPTFRRAQQLRDFPSLALASD